MENNRLTSVADVDVWVRQHGYRRFKAAMLAGEFKGVELRAARAWLLFRHDQRRRAAVFGVLVFAALVGAATADYWLPK